MDIRKIVVAIERVNSEGGLPAERPVTQVAASAIVVNPYSGQSVESLDLLMDMGGLLGRDLVAEALKHLPNDVVSYGKAAIIGANGDLEHGAAVIHPKMGKPIREAIGGGRALIPSNVKIGGPGCVIDVPLGHRHDSWLFDYIDTMSVFVADAPRCDEMVITVALSDGGRVRPRVGKGGAPILPGVTG